MLMPVSKESLHNDYAIPSLSNVKTYFNFQGPLLTSGLFTSK